MPAVAAAAAPAASEPCEASFVVSGIHCAACSITIEQCLAALPGVLAVRVNGASARLHLRWDATRTSESAWARALAPAGYSLALDRAAPARALRRIEARALSWRLFVAALCSMQVMMLAAPSYGAAPGEIAADLAQVLAWGQWVLSLPVMLFSAGPFFRSAWAGVLARRLVMDVPVVLGLLVAFGVSSAATFDPSGALGAALYFDSATMFIALLLGARRYELHLRHRAAEQLEAAGALLPERALRVAPDGGVAAVAIDELRPGDLVRVPLGEALPADGVLLGDTEAAIDEALLSGESRAQRKPPGAALWAGSVNRGALLEMRVQRVGPGTRLAGIEALLREAQTRRPASMQLADRWAAPFIAGVLLAALVSGLAWAWLDPADPRRAIEIAMTVLIVTCPCALSLAVPLAQMAAAQRLARAGVVVQRLDGLERLTEANRVIFDKTGTLTTSNGTARLVPTGDTPGDTPGEPLHAELAWAHAGALGQASHHPVALAIAAALPAGAQPAPLEGLEEVPGQGVRGYDAHGVEWRLGAPAWVAPDARATSAPAGWATSAPAAWASSTPARASTGARAWLARDGKVVAAFALHEVVREDAAPLVAELHREGLRTSLASGDVPARVDPLALRLGIGDALAAASPEAKLAHLAAMQARGEVVVAVGDGFNDGPLLAQADVAVAMSHGAMASQRQAHLLLDSQRPDALQGLLASLRVARAARRIARQNLTWAAIYNAACVPLALVGLLPPWAAGLGMAASSLAVLANAARLNR